MPSVLLRVALELHLYLDADAYAKASAPVRDELVVEELVDQLTRRLEDREWPTTADLSYSILDLNEP